MTHLLPHNEENFLPEHKLFFTNEGKYRLGDKIIFQNENERDETHYEVSSVTEVPALKKGYSLLIINEIK